MERPASTLISVPFLSPWLFFSGKEQPIDQGLHYRGLSTQYKSNPSLCFLQRAKGALQSITAGQKVISKHKNGRFYQCEVVRLTTETFYEVNFDDGSFSDNLYPEDIVVMSASSFLGQFGTGMFLGLADRWTCGSAWLFLPGPVILLVSPQTGRNTCPSLSLQGIVCATRVHCFP